MIMRLVSRRVLSALMVVILLIAAVLVLSGAKPNGAGPASGGSSTSSAQPQAPGPARGFAFSPATYDSNGISDFFSKAGQAAGLVEWAGDWNEIGSPGAPATLAQLASQNGLKYMVVVQFFTQSTGQLLRPLNSTNEQHYLSIAASFAKEYKPAYFGVGIEVNVLYEKNATAFQEFVSLFSRAYDDIKSASPTTMVFTVFQLEKMNGLDGGLYGGTNAPNNAEWQLLAQFPMDDVAAFTTYPSLVYHDPADIPLDYYQAIASHTNSTVGFTEVGWHTGYLAGGWGSNESEQAGFVARFFALTQGLDRAFVVWSFLYDQTVAAPFSSMGLFYVNGTAKQAWQTWLTPS